MIIVLFFIQLLCNAKDVRRRSFLIVTRVYEREYFFEDFQNVVGADFFRLWILILSAGIVYSLIWKRFEISNSFVSINSYSIIIKIILNLM